MTDVCLEASGKRVFASAIDWPGWCRSGRTDEGALETLAEYASRYAAVVGAAGIRFPRNAAATLHVVETVPGSATTDFGAPGGIAKLDAKSASVAEAERIAVLVEACWSVLDTVMGAAPAALRKGPRGGGRDRDTMIGHVLDAEAMYARKIGVRIDPPRYRDRRAVDGARRAITAAIRAGRDGKPPVGRGWPVRYAARRIAWHVMDHAWEAEDRST